MDRSVQWWFAVVVPMMAMVMVMVAPAARGQISTPCNPSVINSFTPCMNFLTNSTSNGSTSSSSPTTQCCDSLKSLTNGGMDCLCLIVTGSVPFRMPINRTLAISLPRACHMPRVPVQCKASGSPLPAPGPVSPGPSHSPASAPSAPSGFTPSPSPQVSSPITPSLAPQSDTTPAADTPSASSGGRSDLTPSSSAISSYSFSPSFLLIALGLVLLKSY